MLHTEKLLDEWLVPVCSPRLLAKHGPVATQADLKKYRLLHSTSEPWRAWLESPTMDIEWAPSGATFDDSVSLIRAAEASQGLVLARWSLVEHEIASGKLVVASKKIVPTDRGYYFVCPKPYCSLAQGGSFPALDQQAGPRGAAAESPCRSDRRLRCFTSLRLMPTVE